jgi:hypothetical protein
MEALAPPRILSAGEMTAPCLRLDVEMSVATPKVPPQLGALPAQCVWLLVSVHTEAIGSVILEVPRTGLTAQQVNAGISSVLGDQIGLRHPGQGELPLPPFLASRRNVLLHAPKISIVICTRERPESLRACLQSLLTQDYPEFSILVVDNAPVTDTTKLVVESLASPIDTRAWPTMAGLRRGVSEYIEGWYNTRRLHSTLGYLSPTHTKQTTTTLTVGRHNQLNEPVRQSGSNPPQKRLSLFGMNV